MIPFHPSNARRFRALLLVVVLLLTLGLAGVLAYQAQDAARSHRSAVESTLHDYAAFAAWEFARQTQSYLGCAFQSTLFPIMQPPYSRVHLPEPTPELWDDECDCGRLEPEYFFSFGLGDGSFVATGDVAPPAGREHVREALAYYTAEVAQPEWSLAMLLVALDGDTHVLAYRTDRRSGEPVAYGFGAPLDQLSKPLGRAFEASVPLPPSLLGDVPTDSVVTLEILAGGREAYRFGAVEPSGYVAEDTLGLRYGGLIAQATVRPELVRTLPAGGLPRSRLPVLVGLFVLAAALVGVALVQLRREYELSRLRDGFVSGVSHELRTPLAQIRMFAETLLLGRTRSEDERKRSLEIIDQEARRLGQLVENVLQFSRNERGSSRIDPQSRNLGAEVRQAIEGFVPIASARNVSLRLELDDGIHAPIDPGAIRQVLLNLLDNAVKYGPAGQTVTVGLEEMNGVARIRVEDQGPGIPRTEREHIWTAFRRLERDQASGVAGTGIGLSVVQEVVRLHDGGARVEDAAGGGARFVIELPISPRTEVAAHAAHPDARATTAVAHAERPVRSVAPAGARP